MQAGAVCCQLEDDNSMYIRFIGVANRHRYCPIYNFMTFREFYEVRPGFQHIQDILLARLEELFIKQRG